MENISAVNNTQIIRDAEFIQLNVALTSGGTQTFYMSTSYRSETIGGLVYSPLGGLLGISTIQRDLSATGFDTNIVLAGVDQSNIYTVLSDDYKIKGSTIKILRGFYDENYVLSSTALRYTGIITNFSISEEFDESNNAITYKITLNSSNTRSQLSNRIAGRYTNPTTWKLYSSNDLSMDDVPNLANEHFDFGKVLDRPTLARLTKKAAVK